MKPGSPRPCVTAFMKACAPYTVTSRADGSLLVIPTYPKDSGGVLSRLGLAYQIEAFLNARRKP